MRTHEQPRDKACWTCKGYGFKAGNPAGWRWTYCFKLKKWFSDKVDNPGLLKACNEYD